MLRAQAAVESAMLGLGFTLRGESAGVFLVVEGLPTPSRGLRAAAGVEVAEKMGDAEEEEDRESTDEDEEEEAKAEEEEEEVDENDGKHGV